MSTRNHIAAAKRSDAPSNARPGAHSSMLVLALGLALGGCASIHDKATNTLPGGTSTADAGAPVIPPYTGGGYYKDDGPGANPPANLAEIPDAVPRQEQFHPGAARAYKVFGRRYMPIADNADYKARGLASWYGRKFHGKPTAIGEIYDMYAMTAAHATLPLPSYARVTNLENGKSVVVRVNDRGPFHAGRIIDLSYTAAYKLDILKGVTQVEVESIFPGDAPASFTAQADGESVVVSAPVAKEKPETSTPSAGIYLQLGAFGNPASADNLLARASVQLSKAIPSVSRLENNGLHKVQAGPFASVDAADRAAESIQQSLGLKAFKVYANIVPSPVAETPPAESPPASSGLYLQLAAVSSPEAANALASRVQNRFGNELPGINQVNVGNLFKVQAGPFATPEDAARIALAYQQDFGVKPYRVMR